MNTSLVEQSKRDNSPVNNTGLLSQSFNSVSRQRKRHELFQKAKEHIYNKFATVTLRAVYYEMPRRVRRIMALRLSKHAFREYTTHWTDISTCIHDELQDKQDEQNRKEQENALTSSEGTS